MFDLFLSAAIITNQSPIIIAQSATVYLPVSTTQSSRKNCVTYKATNSTGRAVKNVNVNRRDSEGKINRSLLTSYLGVGKTKTFELCNNSFVNVEAKQ
jgi:hypothetical protein